MSRRHHGRPRHGRPRPEGSRTATGTARGQDAGVEAGPKAGAPEGSTVDPAATPSEVARPTQPERAGPPERAPSGSVAPPTVPPARPVPSQPGTITAPPANPPVNGHGGNGLGCTAPQLRRFIKSRPYVPMHELRRRFAIEGADDDVTQVEVDSGRIYVGLPEREGALLAELLRGGEIGYELSLDPRSPIVVGVYPMRPVPRG